MKTDLYTKVVLTVIAAALVCLCVLQLTPPTYAQPVSEKPSRVVIAGFDGRLDQALPVKIVSVERGRTSHRDEFGRSYSVQLEWQPLMVNRVNP